MTQTTPPAETPYIFSNSDHDEAERLAGIQAGWDPGTFRHLSDLGVGEGWRCLEVGAGAGSVARWLGERVGEKGSVVATDINTTLLDQIDLPNLEVRRHDLLREELPRGEFDLVHCRLVLMHLPRPEDLVGKMVEALGPGGRILVEDVEWAPAGPVNRRGTAALYSLMAALRVMLRAHHADVHLGRRLPVILNRLGLAGVGAEGRVCVLVGGSPDSRWVLPTLQKIQDRILGGNGDGPAAVSTVLDRVPALRQKARDQVGRLQGMFDDPDFAFLCPTMVAAWGQRS